MLICIIHCLNAIMLGHVVLTIFITLYMDNVSAYPSGAPTAACISATPSHFRNGKSIHEQTTPLPYDVTINPATFQPGDIVRIVIQTKKGAGFRGMFMQVVPLSSKINNITDFENYPEPVGSLSRVSMNTKPLKCGLFLDSITHKDSFAKERVEIEWKAPLYIKTDVTIRATFVANFSTFWSNVDLPRIKLVALLGMQAPETLRSPWLREIAETVKVDKGKDKQMTRDRVKGRFGAGLADMMTPSGHIMINYVNDMINFGDRNVNQGIVATHNVSELIRDMAKLAETTEYVPEMTTLTSVVNSTKDSRPPVESYEEEVNETHKLSREDALDRFVQALLSEDIEAAENLEHVLTLVNAP